MASTRDDGWVWATVAKRGDRVAATEPIHGASGHFQGALRWLGIEASPAFPGERPCNGCADLDDLRTAVQAYAIATQAVAA